MKTNNTPYLFMSIVGDDNDNMKIAYHEIARTALEACGLPPWNMMYQTKACYALAPGDELEINSHSSIIRLSGVEIEYNS